MFAYPELMKKKEKEEKKKVETAVLSTTSKVKARLKSKKSIVGNEETANKDVEMKDADENTEKPTEEKKPEEPQPTEYLLYNPCRMLRAQEKKVSYLKDDPDCRYYPVMEQRYTGFVILQETRELREGEKDEFYDDEERNLDAPNPDLVSDLQIPAPFEFDPDIQNA